MEIQLHIRHAETMKTSDATTNMTLESIVRSHLQEPSVLFEYSKYISYNEVVVQYKNFRGNTDDMIKQIHLAFLNIQKTFKAIRFNGTIYSTHT